MVGLKAKRIAVLLLCVGLSYLWAASIREGVHGAVKAIDFGAVYFGTRCALEHKDPYDPQTVLREFAADGRWFSEPSHRAEHRAQDVVSRIIYPPTAFLVAAPFAELPWVAARTVWLGLISGLLVVAALLMWELAGTAPLLAGCMACYMLLNCVLLLSSGNPVGIVAPFSVIAAWCFVKDRYAVAGVAMLAAGLLLKPHDAGFVWLYFLLAGGTGRKRALQSLAIVAAVGICAVVWITPISPHWIGELRSNLAVLSARGGPADPGPMGASSRSFSPILSLQSAFSTFKDDPGFYNPVSYLIGGGLILVWAISVVRKRTSREGALLALAAISILTMLPVYHRADDAKLLLLTIPACAMLWARRGRGRWLSLGLTAAALFVTSAVPIIFETAAVKKLPLALSSLSGKLTLLALQPAPLVLLAAGCFYLWVYIRYEPAGEDFAPDAPASERSVSGVRATPA